MTLHVGSVDERKINQGTRLTNRSFEWKKRELLAQCLQADDDDNKKIDRKTSIEKTVGKCQVSGNSHQESRKLRRADKEQNAAEAKRAIAAQKTTDSYNRVQKVDKRREGVAAVLAASRRCSRCGRGEEDLNLHGHSRRIEKEEESRTRMTTKSKSS